MCDCDLCMCWVFDPRKRYSDLILLAPSNHYKLVFIQLLKKSSTCASDYVTLICMLH